MTRAPLTVGILAALMAGCSSKPAILPTNDFNRPTDIVFMCFGAYGPDGSDLQVSGRPMRICHPPGKLNMFTLDANDQPIDDGRDPAPGPGNRTFAFMPNSASGDLSLIDADNWRIIDLEPESAGYGRLPVGAVPEQLTASQDGCQLVTANRGACDLTVIDPRNLVQPVFQAASPDLSIPPASIPIPAARTPVDGNGMPLEVAPYEVAFLPQDTAALDGGDELCQHDAAQTSTPWRILATYPSCDLVALIDVPSMTIVDSVKVTFDGTNITLVPQGTTPVCPIADCGEGRKNVPSLPPQTRPSGIAIVPHGDRAYVGLSSVPLVLSLPVDKAAGTLDAAAATGIPLHEGALGTNRVRLAVDPYRYKDPTDKSYAGVYVGDERDRNYLYVIARDGTLAVVDVFNPGAEHECETNIDPQNLPAGVSAAQACIPLDPNHRRPGADGPALRFPTAPIDVAAADIPFGGPPDTREESVAGAYAWVVTASGLVYLVNINPVQRQITEVVPQPVTDGNPEQIFVLSAVPEPEPYPNTLRNRNVLSYTLALDPSSGPPRVEVLATPTTGPYLEPIWTKGTADNATALDASFQQTAIFFPADPSSVRPQTWSVAWQGTIVGPRLAGRLLLRDGPTPGTFKTVLEDDGVDFCSSGPGVVPGDIVTIAGCTADADCGAGLACLKDNTTSLVPGGLTITGLCVNRDNLDQLKKNHDCDALTSSVRRYQVGTPHGQTLELVPHLDELIRSSLRPCEIQTDPKSTKNDCADPNDPTTAAFVCQPDPTGGKNPRCFSPPCETDDDCRQGRTCQDLTDVDGATIVVPTDPNDPMSPARKFCVDGPPLKSAGAGCFYQLLPYSVQVGRGFLVSGSSAGVAGSGTTLPVVQPDQTPVCAPANRADPNDSSYRLVSRISIDGVGATQCTNAGFDNDIEIGPTPPIGDLSNPANPASGINPTSGTAQLIRIVRSNPIPNPCLFLGGPVLSDPLGETPVPTHVRALFQNGQVAFVLADLDRAPPNPLDLRFDVRGGFSPQVVIQQSTIEISAPARLVLGPMDSALQDGTAPAEIPYLFLVDQRRLGQGLAGGPTRGQLLRINPLGQLSTLTTAQGNVPIFDDYSRSSGLFPVQ